MLLKKFCFEHPLSVGFYDAVDKSKPNSTMSFVSPQRWALTAVWLPLQEVALVLHLWGLIVFWGVPHDEPCHWTVPWQRRGRTLLCHRPRAPVVQVKTTEIFSFSCFFKVTVTDQTQPLHDLLLECWTRSVVNAINENNQKYRAHIWQQNKCTM